uniref:PI3K/PI4K catalytic domain-containing protein n=2 Tax=Auxenochlorella protothecoides TaxID=3075 RepID=A0A1D1ZMM4_AUXPR
MSFVRRGRPRCVPATIGSAFVLAFILLLLSFQWSDPALHRIPEVRHGGVLATREASRRGLTLQRNETVGIDQSQLPDCEDAGSPGPAADSRAPSSGPIHVSQCQFCAECELEDGSAMLGSGLTWAEMLDAAGPLTAANASFPMRGSARMHLALCPRCAGCSHALRRLDGKVKFGGGEVEPGPEGISQAYTMAATQIGQTRADVAKLHCVPLDRSGTWSPWGCDDAYSSGSPGQLVALGQLSKACATQDMLPRVWTEEVTSILPGSGYVVQGHKAVMTPVARGVSLLSLVTSRGPAAQQEWARIPSDQVIKAATLDLLTGQCDRHAGNVFVDERGRLALIDNDQMLGVWWQGTGCAASSMFLPGTQKFAKHERAVDDWGPEAPATEGAPGPYPLNPLLAFDYRCHLAPGRQGLGTDFPGPLAACMRRLAAPQGAAWAEALGFSAPTAHQLAARAGDLLRHGFEWVLEQSRQASIPHMRYPVPPPCCAVDAGGRCQYVQRR